MLTLTLNSLGARLGLWFIGQGCYCQTDGESVLACLLRRGLASRLYAGYASRGRAHVNLIYISVCFKQFIKCLVFFVCNVTGDKEFSP